MSEHTAPLADVEIPERVKVQVQHRIPAKDVKVGDFVAGGSSAVAKKTTGPKWTVLDNADGNRILRIENDVEIPVARIEETQESKDARYHAMNCERIVDAVNGWTPQVPVAMEKLNAHVAKGYVIGYSELGTLADAQASDKVWARYCHFVRNFIGDDKGNHVAARDAFVAQLREQIVSKVAYLSNRSSNQMANLIEDEDVTAMANFCERLHF